MCITDNSKKLKQCLERLLKKEIPKINHPKKEIPKKEHLQKEHLKKEHLKKEHLKKGHPKEEHPKEENQKEEDPKVNIKCLPLFYIHFPFGNHQHLTLHLPNLIQLFMGTIHVQVTIQHEDVKVPLIVNGPITIARECQKIRFLRDLRFLLLHS